MGHGGINDEKSVCFPTTTMFKQIAIRSAALFCLLSTNAAESDTCVLPTQAIEGVSAPARLPQCAAVCVIDAYNGNQLYAYNETEQRQVANLQKTVSALCICESVSADTNITISGKARQQHQIRFKGIRRGEHYTCGVLLQAMLMGDYNDICYELAVTTAGSEEEFVKMMNQKAAELGMINSHFVNSQGLPAEQFSTARDMAKAALQAYKNKQIRPYIDTASWDFPLANGVPCRINNRNKLLDKYEWVNGMCTGYCVPAGHCIIATGEHHGKAAIVVILGCKNRKQLWAEAELYLKLALGL